MQKSIYFFQLLGVFSTLFFTACSPSELKPAEYIEWSDNAENNLVKTFQQNNIKLTCQYTTPEYVSLKQTDAASLDEAMVNENIDAVNEMIHFKLQFEDTTSNNFLKNNYTTAEEFNLKSMYLSYDIHFDLKAVQGGDTTECVLNHHERTYGSTPYETLLIAFPKSGTEIKDVELIFNDRVFGLGRVKFFFAKEDLEGIPTLVF
ncbi:MAG: hypothetical protein HYZ14_06280 [Bacteroidetes bacterium]|nr:hypothetical protein [Bacteroidota bacterium]